MERPNHVKTRSQQHKERLCHSSQHHQSDLGQYYDSRNTSNILVLYCKQLFINLIICKYYIFLNKNIFKLNGSFSKSYFALHGPFHSTRPQGLRKRIRRTLVFFPTSSHYKQTKIACYHHFKRSSLTNLLLQLCIYSK